MSKKSMVEKMLEEKAQEGEGKKRGCIYLIGFMGTGKTTVAKALRAKLGFRATDTDVWIVRKTGMAISDIFDKKGEKAFRDMETEALEEISRSGESIVACGGGVALREENRRIMQEYGNVFLLTANPETILKRVKHDQGRPLLNGRKNVKAIAALMEERREFYEKAADFSVAVDGKKPGEIADEIIALAGLDFGISF